MAFTFSLLVTLLTSLFLSVLLTGAMIGAMFGINRLWGEKFGPTNYGPFDLENLPQTDQIPFATRTAIPVALPTILLFLFVWLLYYNRIPGFNPAARFPFPLVIMFLLHAASLCGGLILAFELNPRKAALLAIAVELVYLILFRLLVPWNLILT